MLVLFDIDGTLLRAHGGGMSTMAEAGEALFERPFRVEGVDPSGRLDPHLYAEVAERSGIEDALPRHHEFRARYVETLARRAAKGELSVKPLPGVHELLDTMRHDASVGLGLLTGNYREAAHVKLRAAAIAPEWFPVGAFGDEASDRTGLVPVALARHRAHTGRTLAPEAVVIVGDTPLDVECALSNHCQVVGVATGRYTADALREAGARYVLDDLSRPQDLLELLTEMDN